MYVCMCVCTYTYVHIHIYIPPIHTHTHTTLQIVQQYQTEFVFWVHRVRISRALLASLTDFSFIVLQSLYFVARMGEERGVYRVLVGKPEGRRPLGRPRRRWVDNIRMDLHDVGCGYMDWIGLAQDRDRWRKLVSAVMNLRVP